MKKLEVAVLGPLCKDKVILKGKKHYQLGSAVYYIGHALSCLGADVTVFASYGNEGDKWLEDFKYQELVHIPAQGTIRFTNEYLNKDDLETRIQRAEMYKNEIRQEHLMAYDFNQFEYIIFAPLFHDNFSLQTIMYIAENSRSSANIFLAGQGMIRYLENDKIVFRKPENIINTFPFIDYLFLDENELRFVSQEEDLSKGARHLQEKGINNVIVTKANRGSVLFLGDQFYKIKAFPPQVHEKRIDLTGAGDSYLAGFIKAKEFFNHPQAWGETAAKVATMAIEKRGAFNKSWNDVLARTF
ncbi:hypothetical protein AYK26_03520 [Euryarchaeota archaeon SM23-78]|nr:MAG: hypothetical protein AYK26_03520 [Euryarchaeota archaeon SM23-78]MBW3000559.1 hypothetical protein [Candidatus Woesearchaeota archaeon]